MALVTFDVKSFIDTWQTTQARMDAAGATAWRNAVRQAWGNQKEHGYQNRTGKLTASMRWRSWQRGRFAYRGEIKTSAPYALYVDRGTRPHKITAKPGRMLHFYWPKVGRWVSFKSVNHPGFKGAGFSAAAIQTFGQTAPAIIEKSMGDVAR